VTDRKQQVAIIYPLAEHNNVEGERGALERGSVEAAFHRFKEKWGQRVGMLHGSLSPGEKKDVLDKMKAKEIDILISSTVIEVGIELPSLRALVVMHADRFGAAQLHQLRGRVARKGGEGYFFLYAREKLDPTAQQRLDLLVECSDGFTLAERDAALRGFGDLSSSGDMQSGKSRGLFWGVEISGKDIESGLNELIEA
jgi:ATP-dependent DNA helicase RecG